jgi:hypothetical protein
MLSIRGMSIESDLSVFVNLPVMFALVLTIAGDR